MSVQFESSRKKERERDALRSARKRALDRAEEDAARRQLRKDKEDQWMLPGLEEQLEDNKAKKKKKKEKKSKKSKKKKKKKKSSSSSSSGEEEWVEKEPSPKNIHERQGWMELGGDAFDVGAKTREEVRGAGHRETEKQVARREAEEENRRKAARLELNPNLRDDSSSQKASSSTHGVSDGGAMWLRKAYKRAEERARAEGRSIEDVASERWGSLENFNRLLAKAEGRTPDSKNEKSRHDRLRDFRRGEERRWSRSKERHRRSRSRSREDRRRRRRRRHSSSSSSSCDSRSGKSRRKGFARPKESISTKSASSRDGESRGFSSKFDAAPSGSWKTKSRQDKDREASRAQVEQKEKEDPKEKVPIVAKETEGAVTETVLSDKELNALGAKLVKAELMGNKALVDKLKAKLERAREAKEKLKEMGGADEVVEEEVVLTRTDARGMTRPVDATQTTTQAGKKNRRFRAETHSKGERTRYFADDERHDLKEMFQREKIGTAEDQNGMLARLAGSRGIGTRLDDDYDMDDALTERAARKGMSEAAEKERDRARAIAEHRAAAKTLEECPACFGGPAFQKHLLVAVGRTCFLALPPHASLTEGHCFVAPMAHAAASTLLDEDVWAEMQEFRRALVSLFEAEGEDCVFFESCINVRNSNRAPHLKLECVPVPRELGEMAPMYFQKAIQECEGMWAQNKKLVSLRDRDVRRSVPRELPYFHVDFGNQDGFAHVIEDEREFPRNFAQEIIGGMLDLEHRLWRNPKRESFEAQKAKVLAFGAKWKDVDFTKKTSQRSSSESCSSDSD